MIQTVVIEELRKLAVEAFTVLYARADGLYEVKHWDLTKWQVPVSIGKVLKIFGGQYRVISQAIDRPVWILERVA